jgi:hypothetical protein
MIPVVTAFLPSDLRTLMFMVILLLRRGAGMTPVISTRILG